MLRTTASGKQSYFLNGANCRVLSMSAQKMSFTARMVGRASLIIGEQTFIGSARFVMLDSDIGVGAHGLWSDEILNGGRKFIDIGRHVWLGRRAVVSKNVTIGDGAIVGAASLITKDVPRAVAVGGVPAKVLRTGVTWVNDPGGMSDLEEPDIARLRDWLAEQG